MAAGSAAERAEAGGKRAAAKRGREASPSYTAETCYESLYPYTCRAVVWVS